MKNLLTLILLFFILSVSNAQNTFPSSGNVGIGTTTLMDANLNVLRSSNGRVLQLMGENLDIDFRIGHNATGFSYWWSYKGSRTGNDNDLELWADNQTSESKMVYRIHQDGNIFFHQKMGINTEYIPTDFKLAVDGKAIFEEVTVKNSSNWPDYVFEDDYKLRSLEEVETFIQENKHLPDVPSAATVEEEGISVGEMNKILMQKIEELTLYMIEIEKTNQQQQEQIQEILNQ